MISWRMRAAREDDAVLLGDELVERKGKGVFFWWV